MDSAVRFRGLFARGRSERARRRDAPAERHIKLTLTCELSLARPLQLSHKQRPKRESERPFDTPIEEQSPPPPPLRNGPAFRDLHPRNSNARASFAIPTCVEISQPFAQVDGEANFDSTLRERRLQMVRRHANVVCCERRVATSLRGEGHFAWHFSTVFEATPREGSRQTGEVAVRFNDGGSSNFEVQQR